MTSIQLQDDTAKALLAMAATRRQSVDEYIRSLVSNDDDTSKIESKSSLESELEPLLFDGPSLPADFSRADIYEGGV